MMITFLGYLALFGVVLFLGFLLGFVFTAKLILPALVERKLLEVKSKLSEIEWYLLLSLLIKGGWTDGVR